MLLFLVVLCILILVVKLGHSHLGIKQSMAMQEDPILLGIKDLMAVILQIG